MGDIERTLTKEEPASASEPVVVRIASRIADVPAAEWDASALGTEPPPVSGRPSNPFISHAFLKALEESGSATRKTGWLPQHLLLEDGDGTLMGCMPCYMSSTMAGPTPRCAPAAATIRSSRPRSPSRL